MSKDITIRQYLKFLENSVSTVNKESSALLDDEKRTIDFFQNLPTVSFLTENNIQLLDEPFFIKGEKDQLKRKYCNSDILEELKNYTHLYSITFHRTINSNFTNNYAMYIRGVRKESLTYDE